MKRIISMVVAAALMMCCFVTTVMAAGPTIKVNGVNGSVGEVVTVDVSISGNTGFGAFDMEVQYDTTALKIQAIEGTELVTKQGTFIGTPAANWASFMAIADATGDGVLYRVTFEVLKEGTHEVKVRIDAFSDAATNEITATVESGKVHTHVIGTEWKNDVNNHWNECACGEKANVAAHTWKWVVDAEATTDAAGKMHEECSVCGYKKGDVVIPEKLTVEEVLAAAEWTVPTEDDVVTEEEAAAYVADIAKKALAAAGYTAEANDLTVDIADFVAAANGVDGSFKFTVVVRQNNVFTSTLAITANEVVEEKTNGLIFPRLFNVKVECGEGGSVNTSETFKMAYGSSRTIKISADEGYEVADVIVNGKSVGAVEKYTIKGARTTYTVKVLFEEIDG